MAFNVSPAAVSICWRADHFLLKIYNSNSNLKRLVASSACSATPWLQSAPFSPPCPPPPWCRFVLSLPPTRLLSYYFSFENRFDSRFPLKKITRTQWILFFFSVVAIIKTSINICVQDIYLTTNDLEKVKRWVTRSLVEKYQIEVYFTLSFIDCT